uniref:Secreted protein n=1 Tax=Cacopsylla melanoneura TaxID=428564 RepID=A0A8D8WJA4_9HEMI
MPARAAWRIRVLSTLILNVIRLLRRIRAVCIRLTASRFTAQGARSRPSLVLGTLADGLVQLTPIFCFARQAELGAVPLVNHTRNGGVLVAEQLRVWGYFNWPGTLYAVGWHF